MKKTDFIFTAITMSIVCTTGSISHAADISAGKAKSVTCSACHGPNGISMIPTYPNLAGQKELYLAAQLKAFRDGLRPNPIMAPMSAGLSDDDIANLAAYYASIDPTKK